MSLKDKINNVMDLMDDVREHLLDMREECEGNEALQDIADAINETATPLIKANTALEDVLSAIEDKETA